MTQLRITQLQYPLPRTSVAAAFERDAPSPALEAGEAVAGGGCGPDPPAGRRRIRLLGLRRAQHEKEGAGIFGGDLQAAAGLEIEPAAKPPGKRRGGAQAQRLLERPQDLPVGRGLEEEEPAGLKAELLQPMRIGPAERVEAAARKHQQGRRPGPAGGRGMAEKRRHEAEGGRHVGLVRAGELVHGVEREAALRKLAVDRREPERQHPREAALFHPRQKLAQARDERRAAANRVDPLNVEAPELLARARHHRGGSIIIAGVAHHRRVFGASSSRVLPVIGGVASS